MPIGTQNVQFGGLRSEYRPTGTDSDVALSQYYRGGSYVTNSVYTPANNYATIVKPPGVSDAWPPNINQYSTSYALHEFIFRYTSDIGIPSLANAYVYDTQVTPGVQTPSPIGWRFYWGVANPSPTNATNEQIVYGASNANPATGRPKFITGSGNNQKTYFRPDGGYPYPEQGVNHWQILLSSSVQRMTPGVVNFFMPYGGTVDLNFQTNIWGIWYGLRANAFNTYYNTTVPTSGEISLGQFKAQGNP